jgi:hypothetical protein
MGLSPVFAEENPDFTRKIIYEGIEDPSPTALLEFNPMIKTLYDNYQKQNPDSKITKEEFAQQFIPVFLAVAYPVVEQVIKGSEYSVAAISSLTDPAKLATLKGCWAAHARLPKCVYWLALAEKDGKDPVKILEEAAKLNGTAGTPYAGFVRWGLLENLKIAKELGLLTPKGMAEMRRGKSATITKGQYAGQEAEADHTIPRSVCPELANQVMNLELLPDSLNRTKSDKVTERARVFAKELYDAKLLSEEGWKRVESCFSPKVPGD